MNGEQIRILVIFRNSIGKESIKKIKVGIDDWRGMSQSQRAEYLSNRLGTDILGFAMDPIGMSYPIVWVKKIVEHRWVVVDGQKGMS